MSKRILLVEDEADNMQILRDLLAADYNIDEAENGEQALASVAKQRPDLILMDIQLPVMDGYEATRRLKADPALRAIPIIAITSYARQGGRLRRLRSQALQPPFAFGEGARLFEQDLNIRLELARTDRPTTPEQAPALGTSQAHPI
jgi:two-component system, cell cycle response regulator DivK